MLLKQTAANVRLSAETRRLTPKEKISFGESVKWRVYRDFAQQMNLIVVNINISASHLQYIQFIPFGYPPHLKVVDVVKSILSFGSFAKNYQRSFESTFTEEQERQKGAAKRSNIAGTTLMFFFY